MPFDPTPPEVPVRYTGIAQAIDDALAILGPNGEHWIKNAARCGDSFCVAGAIGEGLTRRLVPRDRPVTLAHLDAVAEAMNRTISAIQLHVGCPVPVWNNSLSRQFPEIRAVLTALRDCLAAAPTQNP